MSTCRGQGRGHPDAPDRPGHGATIASAVSRLLGGYKVTMKKETASTGSERRQGRHAQHET